MANRIASLFDFVREINLLLDLRKISKQEAEKVMDVVSNFDKVLGVIGEIDEKTSLPKYAEVLINQREEARKNKNYKRADEIRNQLKNIGILIEDTKNGVKWRLIKK